MHLEIFPAVEMGEGCDGFILTVVQVKSLQGLLLVQIPGADLPEEVLENPELCAWLWPSCNASLRKTKKNPFSPHHLP